MKKVIIVNNNQQSCVAIRNITIVKNSADPCTVVFNADGTVVGSGVGGERGSFSINQLFSDRMPDDEEIVALAIYANLVAHVELIKKRMLDLGVSVDVIC